MRTRSSYRCYCGHTVGICRRYAGGAQPHSGRSRHHQPGGPGGLFCFSHVAREGAAFRSARLRRRPAADSSSGRLLATSPFCSGTPGSGRALPGAGPSRGITHPCDRSPAGQHRKYAGANCPGVARPRSFHRGRALPLPSESSRTHAVVLDDAGPAAHADPTRGRSRIRRSALWIVPSTFSPECSAPLAVHW